MNFAEMIASMDQDDDDAPAVPLPEAAVASLRETCDRYVAGCPFAVGDLVTPRKDFNMKGAGDPQIVVEVAATPIRPFDGDHGSHAFGPRLDIRFATIARGDLIMFWCESWQYEAYVLPVAEAA